MRNPCPPKCVNTPCNGRKPRLSAANEEVLRVWRLCKRYKMLPQAGGVADQDEVLLLKFQSIDDEVDRWQERELKKGEGKRKR